jgi:large subunit GTPase 1
LVELLYSADLAQKKFLAERENVVIIDSSSFTVPTFPSNDEVQLRKTTATLPIPRRPMWTREMSAEQVDQNEREAFVEWRRGLAEQESDEQAAMSPFERNIDVWRQLWRTVERADVIVQIVDARDPLAYRSSDLDQYVHEQSDLYLQLAEDEDRPQRARTKVNLLLLNKADLLTETQREMWSKYFAQLGVKHAFFSASVEQDKLNALRRAHQEGLLSDSADEASDSEDSEEHESPRSSNNNNSTKHEDTRGTNTALQSDSSRVLTRDELLALLLKEFRAVNNIAPVSEHTPLTIGMVGYPNVGKSSTINVLCGDKRVAVSATPGKTKHFQTLPLADRSDVLLCDCPGLVFPSLQISRAHMVLNGILRIDELRDHAPSVQLLCKLIGRKRLEEFYAIMLPLPSPDELDYDAERAPFHYELLGTYGRQRGFLTINGAKPDLSKAARIVLKDFVTGRLLYCHPPPAVSESEFNQQDPLYRRCLAPEITAAVNNSSASLVSNDEQPRGNNKRQKRRRAHQNRLKIIEGDVERPVAESAQVTLNDEHPVNARIKGTGKYAKKYRDNQFTGTQGVTYNYNQKLPTNVRLTSKDKVKLTAQSKK